MFFCLCFAVAVRGDGISSRPLYGGVVFGYNQNFIKLWAPNQWSGRPNFNGRIINVGNGWGNENYATQQNTAEVRVVITEETSPDFDSGWMTMSAAQGTPNCFFDIPHLLGAYPGLVFFVDPPPPIPAAPCPPSPLAATQQRSGPSLGGSASTSTSPLLFPMLLSPLAGESRC
jgi:hypothetical protein